MRKIVAIGGGSRDGVGMEPIGKEIIRLSGKSHPKVLFIPTASSDSLEYTEATKKYFSRLGCTVDILFLVREKPSAREIKEKILSADIVYVGGGNTLKMMRLWRSLGVDALLRQAYKKGTVLSGISAGAICWFESGHSDSMSFYNPKKWKYINVKGMGLIKGIHCPHYDSSTLAIPRKEHFQKMIQKIGSTGIAIDENCALEFIDGESFKVIQAKKSANAYRVYKEKRQVVSEEIPKSSKLLPITLLY